MAGQETKIFDTDKRIRLGIWGLGRGQSFIWSAKFLNIDVVAGCDFNETMREQFRKNCPDAFVTADEDEFLAQDFDAVLVATYFENHARDSIKALNAGKHVMCEVTSFFTPAQGVALVEAVERSGKIYNLLENYPFSKNNMYVRRLWQAGFFGELMYAEYNYVHECKSLVYSYINGQSVQPGWTAHDWRSWLSFHYYNTHSLGPVMHITGTRPVAVTALKTTQFMNGYLGSGETDYRQTSLGGVAPSLIKMDNGAIVRNLMGATTGDSHDRRLWGRKASVDLTGDVLIRVGASGHGPVYRVDTRWDSLGEIAEKAGHGGGDFWELYYFARQILTGEKAPWDIYSACDVTLAGIMAQKSTESGRTEVIPDFRDPAVREAYRADDFRQKHLDPRNIFPEGHDQSLTGEYTTLMNQCYGWGRGDGIVKVRAVVDGMKLAADMASDSDRMHLIQSIRELIGILPGLAETYRKLRRLQRMYPDCLAGKAIDSALAEGEEEWVLNTEKAVAELKAFLENGR